MKRGATGAIASPRAGELPAPAAELQHRNENDGTCQLLLAEAIIGPALIAPSGLVCARNREPTLAVPQRDPDPSNG